MDNKQDLVYIFLYIIILIGIVFGAFTVFIFKSRTKIFQKEIDKKNLEIIHQEQIVQSILNTQEEERKRIAQDLHDEISSKMNIVSLQSSMLLTDKLSKSETDQAVENIKEISQIVLSHSRQIAHNLLPPVFEKFGLNEAIKELILHFSSTNLKIEYINPLAQEVFDKIPKHNQIHLFRIIQELINNSINHGNATQINIKIDDGKCVYKDNGKGFTRENDIESKGLGTQNILNRIKILNGHFEIKNQEHNGIIALIKF